jgi:hypothetical protein
MTDEEKQAVIAEGLSNRQNRKLLGQTMVAPIYAASGLKGPSGHPCDGCSFRGRGDGCDEIVHLEDGECWVPEGVMAVFDERPV